MKKNNQYMAKTDNNKMITWEEVEKHKTKESRWLVIEGNVYDVTEWQGKHPGGARILGHFAGQDATEAWIAFHKNKELVRKFLTPLYVGPVETLVSEKQGESLKKDFVKLRKIAEKMGLFEANLWFFFTYIAHAVLLEMLGVFVSWYFGATWFSFVLTVFFLVLCQVQFGWIQHDYGHHSVFADTKSNHFVQYIIMCLCKGAGAHWWNFRHFQHHAKSNVFKKDPDVTVPQLFLPGDHVPEKWGRQKRGVAPYNYQHHYFWLLGPTSLVTIYFHLEISYFMLKRRDYLDMFLVGCFGLKWLAEFYFTWGLIGSFILYMTVRLFESWWFTFVTQMSHIPMEINEDQEWDWVTANTVTTTNVTPGRFNDWFTGHLNYQIEHHLFPTMPRHNFHHVAPLVKSLCGKHNLPYTVKPLTTAFSDIVRSLKKSGKIWYDAFYDL